MAIRKGKFLIGAIDDLVFKVVKGQQRVSSKPEPGTVKQTDETKKSASLFGKASKLGRLMRSGNMFSNLMYDMYDGPMVNRLTTTLRITLQQSFDKKKDVFKFKEDTFNKLVGFDFNLDSPLQETMWILPQSSLADGILTVTIPEINIAESFTFPGRSEECTIHIKVRSCNLEQALVSQLYDDRKLEINNSQSLIEKQDFNFTVPDGCLCIAAVALIFYHKVYGRLTMYNTKAFSPSGICGAFITPGDFKRDKKDKWRMANIDAFTTASDKSATTDPASPHSQP